MTTKIGPIWSVFLLGEVEVHDASGQCVLFPGRHAESLFAYLCLEPGKAHAREALAELLWPTQELTSKRTRLRQELAVLRRLFGTEEDGGLLQITRTTVSVVPERILSDWARFQVAAHQLGSPHDEPAVVTILDLYRGPLLTGHDELVNGHRREVEEIFERALWRQVFWAREHRKNTEAVTALQRLLARDPLNLAANTELMRLYQSQGQSGAARRQYQEAERVWQEALGSAPPDVLTEFLQPLSQVPARPEAPRAPVSLPLPKALVPRASAPRHAHFLWLMVPVLLLAVVIIQLSRKKNLPSAPVLRKASVRWYYLDHPGPGEKHTQTDTSSDATAVASLPDGRVCVAGLVDTEKEDVDILAVFFAPDGTLLKRHRFSGPGHDCDRAFCVAVGDPKSFYVAGESYFPEAPGRPKGWYLTLLKYDSGGNLLWSRFSTALTNNEGHGVRVISDGTGGAYLGGTMLVAGKRQPLLLHYATDGALLWSRTVTQAGKEKEATFAALCANSHGDVFLAGNTSVSGNPNTDWLVAAYSPSGQALWQHTVDGPGQGADKVGAIQVSRFDQVFVAGILGMASPPGAALALTRYSASGELQGTSWDSEVQADLRLESAQLSSNGIRMTLAGQFTHADGAVESRVVMFDESGRLRWKLPLSATKPDRSLASPHVLADPYGGAFITAYLTEQTIFNLFTNGDTLLLRVSPTGQLEEKQRFASEDGHPTMDLAADVNNAFCVSDVSPPVLVGQRRELGHESRL
ncbi:BTAD domain-containing putative transcriptional regulator, partial [Armatimonas sp.]|uniref:AfsR/SARP family transcriptional regulator n=1 Tax=Armatimonas sp. TaxID=1872638 RepID=UPI003753387A